MHNNLKRRAVGSIQSDEAVRSPVRLRRLLQRTGKRRMTAEGEIHALTAVVNHLPCLGQASPLKHIGKLQPERKRELLQCRPVALNGKGDGSLPLGNHRKLPVPVLFQPYSYHSTLLFHRKEFIMVSLWEGDKIEK